MATHDLRELAQVCVGLAVDLEPPLRRAGPLTEYAWKFRYPGESEEPSLEKARQALGTAREAYEAVVSRLPGEVLP